MKDKKQALAEVQAKMYKQTYCPGNGLSFIYATRTKKILKIITFYR
jgi:hypothetical protein